MFRKARWHSRARKREAQLRRQRDRLRRKYGWRSLEADAASLRLKQFSTMRKRTFGVGLTGAHEFWANAFGYWYPKRNPDWRSWGRQFREDWE